MSSTGSTINSINSSLLSEISSYQNSTAASSSSTSTASSAQPDQVDFSQIGQLFKDLQQLQSTNPGEFQQVLQDAASKFQTAATQATDPNQAKFLESIAAKFDQAASSGDLSALKAGSSGAASASGNYAPHGHHHHHHQAASTDADPAWSTSGSASGDTQDALIASLLNPTQTSQSATQTQAQTLLTSLLSS